MVDDGTIAAIATPRGSGGLSVLRISGADAIAVADRVFRGRRSVASMKSWTAQYGIIVDPMSGHHLDEAICLFMKHPKSFTGEDTVEFSMHGGVFVSDRVLDAVLRSGARMAGPGEFSRRSFLNGRMDLTRAESVADIIAAGSEREASAAMRKLEGGLQEILLTFRTDLISMLASVEAEIDFTEEEDVQFLDRQQALRDLSRIESDSTRLVSSYAEGRLLNGGISVGLFGRVNVGKSSLFNALVGTNRAIVATQPGTTRDTIEAEIHFDGYRLKVIDTAGLRDSTHEVESEGIARSRKTMGEIDVALLVLDIHEGVTNEDYAIIQNIVREQNQKNNFVVCCNKIDLLPYYDPTTLVNAMKIPADRVCTTSAMKLEGITALKQKIIMTARRQSGSREYDIVVTSARQKEELNRFTENIRRLRDSIENHTASEYLSQDFREVLKPLDRILGNTEMEDVLDVIFHKFCIGK